AGPRQLSQGDIASMVAKRGLAFKLDDDALAELKKAGAQSILLDSIQRSAEDAARPNGEPRPKLVTPGSDGQVGQLSPEDAEKADLADLARLPMIEQARYHALSFTSELPNFVVNQKVTRYVRTPHANDWSVDDTLDIELTYQIRGGEQFKIMKLNGKPTDESYEHLGGATSVGEFSATLGALFRPQSHANFKEVRHEKFRGRDTVVYDYNVMRSNSELTVTEKISKQSIVTAYSGSVWVDAKEKQVLRIECQSDNIPDWFPVSLSESAVEYDWVDIGGDKYLLPIHAEVLLGQDKEKFYRRNVIEFVNYHKFEGDIKIAPGS
ncbi:MAG TPA: hypothetical protein VLZ81_13810, partial [Blastocatellia bacterium]|nr:hypothetical protein [Blastocatellia bacterium]